MTDRFLAEQAKHKTKETSNQVPETLQKPAKRTANIAKEKAKELFDSLNIVKKIKDLLEESRRLSQENKMLTKQIEKNMMEIERLLPAYRVEK